MEDLSKLCLLCMEKKNAEGICPRCGSTRPVLQDTPFLPLGCIINERYYIGAKKRRNSEGCTYVAYDLRENRSCSIREFFPEALAVRTGEGIEVKTTAGNENAFADCLAAFRSLWSTLRRLRGLSALISVYDTFDANGTSYAVYAEAERFTLRDYLLQQNGGYVSWDEARILFMPVLSTLGTLHTSGIIHKGIDPNAFLMTDDGKLKLSGFSISQAKVCYGDLEPDVSDGYAPLEIYTELSDLGAWTDVYSFTAVIYRALIGTTPIASPVRAENDQMMFPAKFAEVLPPYVINAIINGMQIFPEDRTRNTEQLRSNLSASPRAVGASASIYSITGTPEPEPPRTPGQRHGAADTYVKEARDAMNERHAAAERQAESYPPPSYPPVPAAPRARTPEATPRETVGPRTVPPPPRRPVRLETEYIPEEPSIPVGGNQLQASLGPTPQELLEEKARKDKTRRTLIIVLIALLLLSVVGIWLMVSAKNDAKNESTTSAIDTYQVPNFAGMDIERVRNDTFLPTFFDFVEVPEYNADVQAGVIISQDVTPFTVAEKGTRIILKVSSGPKAIAVPDMTGYTYEDAAALLNSMGLSSTKDTKYNDGTHVPGTVVETVPEVNSSVTQGDRITVLVWDDLPETTTLPPVTQLPPTVPYVVPTQPDPSAQPSAETPTEPPVTEPGSTNVDELISDLFPEN